jgi:outer membrane protein OmpA-like peptidoglycan-associated protein
LGLGVGYQSTRLSEVVDTSVGKPGAFTLSGVTSAFAAQAIAGLSFPIPNMPGLSLTVDYRVIDILGGGVYNGSSSIGLAAGSAPLAGSAKIHNQFNQSAMFGVRYAFNTPPPAAVASITPSVEARSYQVAFDPDKTTLSDRAQTIVRNAALASTRQGTTRIAVTGNEGVAGGASRDASDRRANLVVATLVASGVPRDSIFVQSDPGEPGDRRVEIVTS